MNLLRFLIVPLAVSLFAIFPLTDTDIWWHLACAREWVTTWTPVRTPILNVHEYFQQVVGFVYALGGAPLLVAFKALLWGGVFALFLFPLRRTSLDWRAVAFAVVVLFLLRFQFEIRPVVFSMLFLGIFWNLLPRLFDFPKRNAVLVAVLLLCLQWLWCRFQGLYVLGPLVTGVCILFWFFAQGRNAGHRAKLFYAGFWLLLCAMPLLHEDGLALFVYPFGLLDRLLGLSESAAVFASGIAENRSLLALVALRENLVASAVASVLAMASIILCVRRFVAAVRRRAWPDWHATSAHAVLAATAFLALVAERNVALFLPVFACFVLGSAWGCAPVCRACRFCRYVPAAAIFLVLGFWCRSLMPYDATMVARSRVPVAAAQWMKAHPHAGRLFNDDRAGGYLAFVNPGDSIYLDGRFILKTADFFSRYLGYAGNPDAFMHDMDSLGVDRALFPLRYYARWDAVVDALSRSGRWTLEYVDNDFVVFDRNSLR